MGSSDRGDVVPADGRSTPQGSMRALVQDAYGSPDVLHLVATARPVPGVDDVLVRVRAAGLHIGDWHVLAAGPTSSGS